MHCENMIKVTLYNLVVDRYRLYIILTLTCYDNINIYQTRAILNNRMLQMKQFIDFKYPSYSHKLLYYNNKNKQFQIKWIWKPKKFSRPD